MQDFITTLKNRRTHYKLGPADHASDHALTARLEQAVLYTPSAFNMQSARVALLFGDSHKKLWQIVLDVLKEIVPKEQFPKTEQKIGTFSAGHGTVLYFEDRQVISEFREKFPLYKDNIPNFAYQGNAMLQLAIWLIFEEDGLGASLQHYNPLIDERVQKEFQFPESWELTAQMPFGSVTGAPDEKEILPLESRMRVLN